jgi:hypothetical protein
MLISIVCIAVGYEEGRVVILLTDLIPLHLCDCPKPRLGFTKLYVVIIFAFRKLR